MMGACSTDIHILHRHYHRRHHHHHHNFSWTKSGCTCPSDIHIVISLVLVIIITIIITTTNIITTFPGLRVVVRGLTGCRQRPVHFTWVLVLPLSRWKCHHHCHHRHHHHHHYRHNLHRHLSVWVWCVWDGNDLCKPRDIFLSQDAIVNIIEISSLAFFLFEVTF